MIEYTVSEFRKNTREILNAVDQGADVCVRRWGKRYSIAEIPEGAMLASASEKVREDSGKAKSLCPHGSSQGLCRFESCNKRARK
jgi:hypothetical protein